jgi:hypothetical protein
MRMPAQNGKLGHSELEFGDSLIMLADVFPEMGGQTPQSLGGHRRAADPGGGGAGARFAGPGARRPEPTASPTR